MRQLTKKIIQHGRLLYHEPERFLDNVYNTLRPGVERDRRTNADSQAIREFIQHHPALVANCRIVRDRPPTINILLPALSRQALTGGPNTAINLAYWTARLGVNVRLVAVYDSSMEQTAVWQQVLAITGGRSRPPNLEIATMTDFTEPLLMSPMDLLVATFWPTAHLAQSLLEGMQVKEFLYLIQDFEPGFYPWSSNYAMALASYDLDFRGIINEPLLAGFLSQQRIGRFADPAFADRSLVFHPAVDSALFYPTDRSSGRHRLLFYARPQQPRNMFALGLQALRVAVAHPAFCVDTWEFFAIGAELPDIPLGPAKSLRFLPWSDYQAYAGTIRDADVLLCLMLSPHTSYPVLEMAACGGLVVTNSFANKTQEALADIFPAIAAAQPTTDGVAAALVEAAERCTRHSRSDPFTSLPGSWEEALQTTTAELAAILRARIQSTNVGQEV